MVNGYAQAQEVRTSGYIMGAGAVEPPRQPLLSEIRDEISSATKEVLSLAEACRGAADNLFGPVPQTPAVNQNTSPSLGRAGEVRDQLSLLHGAISLLRSEIFRLQSL